MRCGPVFISVQARIFFSFKFILVSISHVIGMFDDSDSSMWWIQLLITLLHVPLTFAYADSIMCSIFFHSCIALFWLGLIVLGLPTSSYSSPCFCLHSSAWRQFLGGPSNQGPCALLLFSPYSTPCTLWPLLFILIILLFFCDIFNSLSCNFNSCLNCWLWLFIGYHD